MLLFALRLKEDLKKVEHDVKERVELQVARIAKQIFVLEAEQLVARPIALRDDDWRPFVPLQRKKFRKVRLIPFVGVLEDKLL